MEGIALPLFQLPLAASPSSSSSSYNIPTLPIFSKQHHFPLSLHCHHCFHRSMRSPVVVLVGSNKETTTQEDEQLEYEELDPQDLEYVRQIKGSLFFFLTHSYPCFFFLLNFVKSIVSLTTFVHLLLRLLGPAVDWEGEG